MGVLDVLKAHGCPEKFFGWVKTCISTPKYSIAENGGLVGMLNVRRGVNREVQFLPIFLLWLCRFFAS